MNELGSRLHQLKIKQMNRKTISKEITQNAPLGSKKILIGMPKEKYDPPDPRRIYTIMSAEEVANGKKSHWAELEISGRVRSLSTSLWSLTHLTALHLNDNYLSRIPPDIAKLHNLVYLDLSSNKLRSLPAELGNMVSLRELLLNNNLLRVLPYELGRLFQLQTLGLKGPYYKCLISLLLMKKTGLRDISSGHRKQLATLRPLPLDTSPHEQQETFLCETRFRKEQPLDMTRSVADKDRICIKISSIELSAR
ncbi:TPA: CCR4-NOT transcription complex, subunit 6-like [Bos taurus]|nr:TPA: CCR4-NOT transcription complex, subunit 6-like [Bos taurus]